jgi:hypothetical protein
MLDAGRRRELVPSGDVDRAEVTSNAGNAAEPLDRVAQELRCEMRRQRVPDPSVFGIEHLV